MTLVDAEVLQAIRRGQSTPSPASTAGRGVRQSVPQGDKKNAPPPPDYRGAAEAQADSSATATAQQTQANRPDQTTPFASSQWRQNPDGSWNQTTGFAGGLGQLANSLTGQAQQMGQPLDTSAVPELTSGNEARAQAINAAYGAATSRLNPMWGQREDAERTRLLNQGLDEKSAAFQNAMSNFGRDRNDAYNQALASAIGQGTQAGSALFQQSLAGRQQGMSELLGRRALPMHELQQLSGFLAMPGFQGAGAAQPTQYLPAALAAGQYGMDAWRAQQQAQAETMRGLTSLIGSGVGAAMFLSDERVKRNIRRHESEALPGVPWASWEWAWALGERQHGVIAQDLLRIAPQHVYQLPNGLLAVDYSFLREGE